MKSTAKPTERVTRILLSLTIAASSMPGAFALKNQSDSVSDEPQTDGTFIVSLKKHSDRNKARNDIANEAQGQTIKDIHVSGADVSYLHVRGNAAKLQGLLKNHPEIKSVRPNLIYHNMLSSTPNDPEFSQQWPLAQMKWPAARQQFGGFQLFPVTITILADGCDPVFQNAELGTYVKQYNAQGSSIFPMPTSGTFATGGGEGDVDTSITGALTDNVTIMAGSGCFAINQPARLTMLQMTTTGSVSTDVILNSLAWAVDHQKERGGQGPVNLSYGSKFSTNPKAAPLWSDPDLQQLAGFLLEQGDILVMSCGDNKGTWNNTKFPAGNVVVVQGTDIKGAFYKKLTTLKNDPCCAPGAPQPGILGGQFTEDFYGTSFSAPFWSSAIAMLIAYNPSLSSAQAHQIILNTGTSVKNNGYPTPSYPAVVPAFDRAIDSAIH